MFGGHSNFLWPLLNFIPQPSADRETRQKDQKLKRCLVFNETTSFFIRVKLAVFVNRANIDRCHNQVRQAIFCVYLSSSPNQPWLEHDILLSMPVALGHTVKNVLSGFVLHNSVLRNWIKVVLFYLKPVYVF